MIILGKNILSLLCKIPASGKDTFMNRILIQEYTGGAYVVVASDGAQLLRFTQGEYRSEVFKGSKLVTPAELRAVAVCKNAAVDFDRLPSTPADAVPWPDYNAVIPSDFDTESPAAAIRYGSIYLPADIGLNISRLAELAKAVKGEAIWFYRGRGAGNQPIAAVIPQGMSERQALYVVVPLGHQTSLRIDEPVFGEYESEFKRVTR